MKKQDFYYDLPKERIAQTPIEPRDHSKMMVLHRDTHTIDHKHFYDILDYLKSGDCLILNDTRVCLRACTAKKKRQAHTWSFCF